ncbi:hypothetical protein [Mesorhizobium sp. ORS 3428]|uniref:hypothetical protein n=1 Tax=Mesorhizobium sp. ORS 3428 TaxID=540997 RepID=UPI0008DB2EC3|nr:hypothetical protein [Mesorhizobium sp. ORS 3428]OHV81046.1 hypothetical protein ORS3428_27760 [Mesorhizobium sp. ORS 3428]
MAADTPLWTPRQERSDAAPLTAFMKAAEAKAALTFSGYAELHRWSIDNREAFWSLVWDFSGLPATRASGTPTGALKRTW